MKRLFKGTAVALALMSVLVFSGCDEFFALLEEAIYLSNVSGNVVNAKADGEAEEYWKAGDDSLADATISFYAFNETTGLFGTTAAYSTSVTASGTYSIAEIDMGKYKIVGSKTGWTFVPRIEEISGENVQMPTLMAFPNEADYTITVLLSWEDVAIDLDSHLTYWNGTADSRSKISWTNKTYSEGTDQFINLDRDVTVTTDETIPRVETMTISAPASFASAPYFAAGTYDEPMGPYDYTGDYSLIDWMEIPNNQLRFYVHAFTSGVSLTGLDGEKKSAFAQVDVMYTDPDGAIHIGSWPLPWNTDETTLHVVNIDAVDQGFFHIYSAGNTSGPDGMRSLDASGPVEVDEIR